MTNNSILPLPLTAKEKGVLQFIETRLGETGIAPSYQEIRDHFGFASFNSVQNYLKQLSQKGYIAQALNQKRAIQILHPSGAVQKSVASLKPAPVLRSAATSSILDLDSDSQETPHGQPLQHTHEGTLSLSLPLLGRVAAGAPIEEYEHDEYVDVPVSMVRNRHKTFALKVKGQSMIDEGILDGDVILVQKQNQVTGGEIVVASVDGESTVKRLFYKQNKVELRPANTTMQSMWYESHQVQIQGVVVGLLRKF